MIKQEMIEELMKAYAAAHRVGSSSVKDAIMAEIKAIQEM